MAKPRNKKQVKTPPSPQNRYFIRKFVSARSVTEALLLEKNAPVDGVWVEKVETPPSAPELIGFRIPNDDGDDD